MTTHAVVIGGSMAGLMAARMLRDHFEHVTIIERDKLPDGPEFRNGAPQGRHLHALLAQGQQIMEAMFPGLDRDMDEIGAVDHRWGTDSAYLTSGGWIKRSDMGITTKLISRIALEYLVRRRLAAHSNVHFMVEHDVQGLLTDDSRRIVTGVRTEVRRERTTRDVYCDLVVDASGRGSKAPEWLQAIGCDAPEESSVYAYIGYATRIYEKPADDRHDWKVLFINGRPADGLFRGGAVFEVEGNRWIITLGGLNRDYPPTDEAGFLEYARSLASPALYDAIKEAKPLTAIYGYRYDGNRFRHYERLSRSPERFVVMGDALCGFNPLYGQGMTVAAMEARELGRMLARRDVRQLDGFAAQFQRRAASVARTAWLMATGEDLRYPATEGARPDLFTRFTQRYIDRVLAVMPNDELVTRAFIEVSNLRKSPLTLFAPQVVLRVLRTGRAKMSLSPGEMLRIPTRPVLTAK